MNILSTTLPLLRLSAVVSLVVFIAIIVDLILGWMKAKQRGEAHTSYALARTSRKFLSYEGCIIVASCMDILFSFIKLWQIIGLDVLDSVPVISSVIGIYLCFVEFMSIREKADEKEKRRFRKADDALSEVLSSSEVGKMLVELIRQRAETNIGKEDTDVSDG